MVIVKTSLWPMFHFSPLYMASIKEEVVPPSNKMFAPTMRVLCLALGVDICCASNQFNFFGCSSFLHFLLDWFRES